MNKDKKAEVVGFGRKKDLKCIVVPASADGVISDNGENVVIKAYDGGKFSKQQENECDEILSQFFNADFSSKKKCYDRNHYAVHIRLPKSEKERFYEALKICGFEGVTDWLNNCKKRLIMQYEEIKGEI